MNKKKNIDNENAEDIYRKILNEIYVPGVDIFDAIEDAEKEAAEIIDDWDRNN